MSTPAQMNGVLLAPTLDFDDRVAQLSEDQRRMIQYHSGNTPEGPELLLEALENHTLQNPNAAVMHIYRRPPRRGRPGGIEKVKCGLCGLERDCFQNIADHIVISHFGLSLWSCVEFPFCYVSCSRRSDLDRHLETIHGVPRPSFRKKGTRSPMTSPLPSSPPLAAGTSRPPAGRVRHDRTLSRNREPQAVRPYPTQTTSVGDVLGSGGRDPQAPPLYPTPATLVEDVLGERLFKTEPGISYAERRWRQEAGPLINTKSADPIPFPPHTVPPMAGDASLRPPNPTGGSSFGHGGGWPPDATSLRHDTLIAPLPLGPHSPSLSTPIAPYYPGNFPFLAQQYVVGTSGIPGHSMLPPGCTMPTPTPIQSPTAYPRAPPARNFTQDTTPPPLLYFSYHSANITSPPFPSTTTSFQQYYPPRA